MTEGQPRWWAGGAIEQPAWETLLGLYSDFAEVGSLFPQDQQGIGSLHSWAVVRRVFEGCL